MNRNLTRVRHNLSAIFGVPLEIGYLNRRVVLTRAWLPRGREVRFTSSVMSGKRAVSEDTLELQLVYQMSKAMQ